MGYASPGPSPAHTVLIHDLLDYTVQIPEQFMDGVPCEDFSFPLIQAEDFTVADPPVAVGAKGAEGFHDHVVPAPFEEDAQESWHLVDSNGFRVVAPPEAPALLSGPLFWNWDFCSTDWDCTVEHPGSQALQVSLEVDPSATDVEGVPRNTQSPRPFRSRRQVRGCDLLRCCAKPAAAQESALQFRAMAQAHLDPQCRCL